MIVIAGFVIGALWGGWLARRRKGKPADIAQYAAVYGIAFAIIGMFITIFAERLL